ncbi:MAG TPA: exonuclease SbcCD subunit D [Chitinophagaceae bacterium]|nr:exonuclease SbcCD subunit D [Chitinophagaceae bacterium]
MRILHTADWHLGKKLDNFSRHEEQELILKEIIQIANEKDVDIVIVAGDLFDNFNPSNASLELYYHSLKELTGNGKRPVFAIAGNHDSPDKINTTDVLARSLGIYCFGNPKQELQEMSANSYFSITKTDNDFTEIKFNKYDYPLRLIHTPYANEQRLKESFDFNNEEWELNLALKNHWELLSKKYCDSSGVNILMSHLFMIPTSYALEEFKEPDGERPLQLGNASLITADTVPNEIQYVALGHLHKYIHWKRANTDFVYSGSPLIYSFSEAMQEKHVIIVDIEPENNAQIQKIALKKGRNVRRMMDNSVEEAIKRIKNYPEDLLELTLKTDSYINQEELQQLREAHDYIIRLIPQPKIKSEEKDWTSENAKEQNIDNLFEAFFETEKGIKPNEEILSLFKEIVNL